MGMTFFILGIIATIVVTIMVSHYYYRRTTERKLTPFIHLHSEVFANITPDVRKETKILFKNEEIEDLTDYQVLIANTGDRSIRDFISPLTIQFPEGIKIMDASVLYKSPKELDLDFSLENSSNASDNCKFSIPLLNKSDFFLIKFLLKGKFEPFEPKYLVTVDDIPPMLSPAWISPSATNSEKLTIDWFSLITGIVIALGSLNCGYLIYLLWKSNPTIFPYPWDYFEFSLFTTVPVCLAILFIIQLFIGALFTISGLGFKDYFSRGKHKFPLPPNIRTPHKFLIRQFEIVEEMKNATLAE